MKRALVKSIRKQVDTIVKLYESLPVIGRQLVQAEIGSSEQHVDELTIEQLDSEKCQKDLERRQRKNARARERRLEKKEVLGRIEESSSAQRFLESARWIENHGHFYAGKWVALTNGQLVGSGEDRSELQNRVAGRYNLPNVLFYKVPPDADSATLEAPTDSVSISPMATRPDYHKCGVCGGYKHKLYMNPERGTCNNCSYIRDELRDRTPG